MVQGGGASGSGGVTLMPFMSVSGNLSSLPPPLSHPLPPALFPVEFGSFCPQSPSVRTTQSTSITSMLSSSPSSTLSPSSDMSLDDLLDYDVDSLVDTFQLPLQTMSPRRVSSQRMFHPTFSVDAVAASIARSADDRPSHSSYQLPAAVTMAASHVVDDVPALPITGDMQPGCLLWQQEIERLESMAPALQQLGPCRQQQTSQQPAFQYRQPVQRHHTQLNDDSRYGREQIAIRGRPVHRTHDADDHADAHHSSSSSISSGSSEEEESDVDDSLVKRAHSRSRSRASMTGAHQVDSGYSSPDESNRSSRASCADTHKSRHGRGGSKNRTTRRHKRGRKRKHSRRRNDESEDSNSDQEQQQEQKKRTSHSKSSKARSVESAATAAKSDMSSLMSPHHALIHHAPSPSSLSTSTAASSNSSVFAPAINDECVAHSSPTTWITSLPSSSRRPSRRSSSGRHRSKLPSRVVGILRAFFIQHVSHPFPCEDQKRELVYRTELSMKQVCDWFTNNRKRYWKPYERRMDKLKCGLVGTAYRTAQKTAGGTGRRNNHKERTARTTADSDRASHHRPACRCGEDDVAIHDWRQMWD